MKNKKILKIISAVIAGLLIIGILVFTNAFVGNPIAAATAKNAAKKHIEINYPNLNLELEKPVYNFKDGNYMIKAYSETSKDTYFNIYYRDREIRDDYETSVADKFNTIMRLADEYTALVREKISEKFGYKENHSYVFYDKDIYSLPMDYLELDMDFDRKLPLKAEVTIETILDDAAKLGDKTEEIDLQEIGKLLESMHDEFLKNDMVFIKYNVSYGYKTKSYNIYNVRPDQIEAGELHELFLKAIESSDGEYEGISIFIKE